jgi:hypothetical protein
MCTTYLLCPGWGRIEEGASIGWKERRSREGFTKSFDTADLKMIYKASQICSMALETSRSVQGRNSIQSKEQFICRKSSSVETTKVYSKSFLGKERARVTSVIECDQHAKKKKIQK